MTNHYAFGLLIRTSLPLFAATFLLSGCGGKDDPVEEAPGDEPAATVEGTACDADADCNDFIYCNGEESCEAGYCRQGTPINCNDGIKCTVDRCKEDSQSCENTAPDLDGDGHFDSACKDDEGAPLGDDCDDEDALSYPGNHEVCDAENRDEDCDPGTFGTQDSDQDGFVDARCCNKQKGGGLLCGDDCDDKKTNVNPAATEACDFLDNNCDGDTDEGVSVTMYEDKDHDGRGDDSAGTVTSCVGAVGFALVAGDCDDNDPEVFEGQFEICDEKDNNCNGVADEVQEQTPWYADVDGDGYGDAESTPILSCYRIPGRVLSQNDCDDTAKKVNPNATEICDGLDNDCNGRADFKLAGVNNFEDDDADGAADSDCGGTDCNDNDPRTSEGAEEVCDRIDNDCDGEVDEQTVQNIWYIDEDGDGWGVVIGSALASCDPIPDRASNFGDCDDGNRDVKPGVAELCDGVDNDCDGTIDEGAGVHCGLNNALSTCRFGGCEIFSCYPGFADTDHNPANGCEATVDPASLMTTTPCAVDLDCNDANLCNGIETCLGGFCRKGTPINCDAGPSVIQGDVTIRDGRDIKDMEGIDRITGDLTIDATLLSSLVGLESLKIIGGNLYIANNTNLIRLSGSALSNLEAVGGDVVIQGNQSLISVSLPNLVSANSVIIVDNAAIRDVGGFPKLANIDQILVIADNDKLRTITGFEALARIGGDYEQSEGSCGGEGGLEIAYNMNLRQINAFGALGRVEGDLCITDANSLDTLQLPNLYAVDNSLVVGGLEGVANLDFPSLDAVGSDFLLSVGGGEGGPSAIQSISAPSLMTIGGELRIDGGAYTIEDVSFPALTDVGNLNIDFFGWSDELTNFDFKALKRANDISIYYVAQTVGVPVWTFPALKTVTSNIYLDLSANITGVRFPQLTRADSIQLNVNSDSLDHIRFPLLNQVGWQLAISSPVSSTPANEINLGALVTAGSSVLISIPTVSLDISQLTTVGTPLNDGSLTLCAQPFDVCPDAQRLESNGFTGANGGYDDCGLFCISGGG